MASSMPKHYTRLMRKREGNFSNKVLHYDFSGMCYLFCRRDFGNSALTYHVLDFDFEKFCSVSWSNLMLMSRSSHKKLQHYSQVFSGGDDHMTSQVDCSCSSPHRTVGSNYWSGRKST